MGKILGGIKILGIKEIPDLELQNNYKTETTLEPEPAGEVNLRKFFKWMRKRHIYKFLDILFQPNRLRNNTVSGYIPCLKSDPLFSLKINFLIERFFTKCCKVV